MGSKSPPEDHLLEGSCLLCGESGGCCCGTPPPPPPGGPPTVQPSISGRSDRRPVPTGARRELFREEAGTSSGRRACPECDRTFPSTAKLRQHLLSHTGERPHTCAACGKGFSSKFKLMRHSLIHSEKKAYVCPICQRTFHRKDHLKNHSKVHAPVKTRFKCPRPNCDKEYSSTLSLRKHEATHAALEGNTTCTICHKTFPSREAILFHLKVHAGSRSIKTPADKKHKCGQCEQMFFTGKDVRRHEVVHTGRRDFLCQHCPQRFGRKDHLVRHVKKSHAVPLESDSNPKRSRPRSKPVQLILEETRVKEDSETETTTDFFSDELLLLLEAEGEDVPESPPQTTTPLPAFQQAFPPPGSG